VGISLWLVVQDDGAQRAAAQARPRGTLHKVPPAGVPVSGPRPVRWVPEEYGSSILLYAIPFNLSRLSSSVRGKVGC
jgi:hypothetical protein